MYKFSAIIVHKQKSSFRSVITVVLNISLIMIIVNCCKLTKYLGSDEKEVKEEESDLKVLAPDLIKTIESSILTFHLFLKMDKRKSGGVRDLFGGQTQLATPLQQVQSSLKQVQSCCLILNPS